MSQKDGWSAFPVPRNVRERSGYASVSDDGMSLRDYFAGQAIKQNAGYVADLVGDEGGPINEIELQRQISNLARAAYLIAEAMLAERSKS